MLSKYKKSTSEFALPIDCCYLKIPSQLERKKQCRKNIFYIFHHTHTMAPVSSFNKRKGYNKRGPTPGSVLPRAMKEELESEGMSLFLFELDLLIYFFFFI